MNLLGDLDTYADELDGEKWHNAAKACRDARAEIAKLRAELEEIAASPYGKNAVGIARKALANEQEGK
jgi:hypothetical protein